MFSVKQLYESEPWKGKVDSSHYMYVSNNVTSIAQIRRRKIVYQKEVKLKDFVGEG